ncbi:hypothetical protein H5410_055844 [Solanum commersonii]|uniref:Uncharacterized protein n=1 Tax=Solanum commersonii TaxID=4109 RepID=A0A9J5WLF3_SOLCO|nr:hypothetical protein H5410_055844 [Solanum commersonii]
METVNIHSTKQEGGRETEGDRDAPWPICIADDEANDDLRDDNEDKEARLEESNGVDSDAGGSPLLVLASRLQMGQNVLHDVSHASTHIA